MAGEGHLGGGGEEADAGVGVGGGGRQDEGRLGEVHPPRDGLHLVAGQAIGVEDDDDRIAAERAIAEDIGLDEVDTTHGTPIAYFVVRIS